MAQLARIHQIQAANDIEGAIQLRDEWVQTVNTLAKQVSEWACRQEGWQVVPLPDKKMNEAPLGAYTMPVFWIRTGRGTVLFEPGGRDVGGSDGLVELRDYPGMFPCIYLAYYESDQAWKAHTDSGLDWPHPWSEATFLEVVNGLIAHDLSACSAIGSDT